MSFGKGGRNFRGRRTTRQLPSSLADGFIVQVHFAGKPGTTKRILNALRRDIATYLDTLRGGGHLILAGRYFSSVGGIWLLKVRHIPEADKLVREYPPVKQELLTYRTNVLVDLDQVPAGLNKPNERTLEPA